ncbi:MAG: nickel pincer cofactor biosynthesis protein LarC [bacterium]|nr:nickel pincer cofactor biosynthesis protein LarC [bacterium]
MGRVAYFDCAAGVSGDMILGSLLDAGLRTGDLEALLRRVPLRGWRIEARRVRRAGLAGTRARVLAGPRAGKGMHGPDDLIAAVRKARLPATVARTAERAFRMLARAEAAVHGRLPRHAHFHEVGAVDSIIDVVGSIAGLHLMGVGEVYASALPWNEGTVECAHGTLPVPAPAAAALMAGLPVVPHPFRGELVTPTGVVILKACGARFGVFPPMTVSRVAYGAGDRRIDAFPNLLRIVLGDAGASPEAPAGAGGDVVSILETAIDDLSPAVHAYLCEALRRAGALDLFVTAALMKKGRSGHLLTVICPPDRTQALADIIFRESTTLGIRVRTERRLVLRRREIAVGSGLGRVRVKLAERPGGFLTASPEYEDCARIAAARGVPLAEVMAAAARATRGRAGRRRKEEDDA